MGDMADFVLEQVQVMEDLRDQYNAGDIEMPDAYELGIIDELGNEIGENY